MTSKKINLIIGLKDGVSGKLRKIGGALKTLGGGFKKLAIAGVAMGTAVLGGLGALAKAYADQESVNSKLKASFDAAGESGAKAVIKWGAWATAIQRTTTLGDEEIMNLVSLAKIMGVSNKRIGEATKGAIGLSKAFGIDLQTSMKMVALAFQGEYTMLNRYIPALRSASTEAEKAAVLQKAMATGFKLAEAELNTLKGQVTAFKGVFGDAMQAAGAAIFGDGGLTGGIEQLKNKIIELEEDGTVAKWAGSVKTQIDEVVGKIKELAADGSLKQWAGDIKTVFDGVATVIKGIATAVNLVIRGVKRVGVFAGGVAGEEEKTTKKQRALETVIPALGLARRIKAGSAAVKDLDEEEAAELAAPKPEAAKTEAAKKAIRAPTGFIEMGGKRIDLGKGMDGVDTKSFATESTDALLARLLAKTEEANALMRERLGGVK